MSEIVRLLHSEAVHKGIQVKTRLAEDLPPVQGNRAQLQQVLVNLITNGFEASREPAGEESILMVITDARDGAARVSVRDQGTGFPDGNMEDMFAPFCTTKSDGLGMGLAVTRRIVEFHGGRIWAENNPDRGATVHITMPFASDEL